MGSTQPPGPVAPGFVLPALRADSDLTAFGPISFYRLFGPISFYRLFGPMPIIEDGPFR